MSTGFILLLIVLAFAISIILGKKTKINFGIYAMICALLIGKFALGLSYGVVISYFPSSLVFMIISVNFFFAILLHNGAMDVVAQTVVYQFRNRAYLLPFVLSILSFLVCAVCGPLITTFVMVPMTLVIGKRAGIHPLLSLYSVFMYPNISSLYPFNSNGVMLLEYLGGVFSAEEAYSLAFSNTIPMFIISTAVLLALYFITKAYKVKTVEIDTPKELTAAQKNSLIILLIVMILVIVPPVANLIFKTAFTAQLASICDIRTISLIAGVICCLLKYANANEILATRIPWTLIVLVSGCAMLIGIATNNGTAQYLAALMTDAVSPALLFAVLTLIGALMACVSDGLNVVIAGLVASIPPMMAATGFSAYGLVGCLITSVELTSISPFSTGGANILGIAGEILGTEATDKLFVQQLAIAFINVVVAVIVALLGIYRMI